MISKGKTVIFIVNFPGGTSTMQGKVKDMSDEFVTITVSNDDEPYHVSPDQILGVQQ